MITSEFSVKTLLFIKMLQSISREIRSGCPEELLYIDDLALIN